MFEMHQMQDLIDISQGNTAKRCLLIDKAHRKKKRRLYKKNGKGINQPVKFYIYKGAEYCLRELADLSGINGETIRMRLARGWSVEKAVQNPLQRAFR